MQRHGSMCDSSYCAICAFAPFTKHTRIEKRERERKQTTTNLYKAIIVFEIGPIIPAPHTQYMPCVRCSRACVNMQESTRAKIKINERQFVDRDGAGFVRRFNFCCCCVSLFVSHLEFYFYFYKSNTWFYSSKLFC